MIAFFDAEDIVTTIIMQGLDMGGIGTQTVFGDDEFEMRVILAQLGNEALGGVAFAIIFLCALLLYNRFGHQWDHFTNAGRDDASPYLLVIIRDRPVAGALAQTRPTVHRLGEKKPRA